MDSHANSYSTVEPQKMSQGDVRRVSRQDIQLVQDLIERCLQLYMNQTEVMDTLLVQAKIEPGFTELVWQKLEEENREFFKAYHLRLIVKHQIMIFNKLLEQQVELRHKVCLPGVAPLPVSNGMSHSSSLHQASSSCYAPEPTVAASRPDNRHLSLDCPPNAFLNGSLPVSRHMHTTNGSAGHNGRMDTPTNIHSTQTSHMGVVHRMNGIAVKLEPGRPNNSAFTFGPDGNVLDTHPPIGDTCVTSFSSSESNSQPLTESPLLDAETSSFGFLGQIPRNFSLSDLTADFSQSSDILGSYSGSPFLATDDFMDSPARVECQGETKRFDTVSGGKSFDDY